MTLGFPWLGALRICPERRDPHPNHIAPQPSGPSLCFVSIELVRNKDPLGQGIDLDGTFDVLYEVIFSAGLSYCAALLFSAFTEMGAHFCQAVVIEP